MPPLLPRTIAARSRLARQPRCSPLEGANVSGNKIWLRLSVDIRPGTNRQGRFSYSTDGSQFTSIGTPFSMTNDWQFFMGYRFAIFNFTTQALGGSVTVGSFSLTAP